jgi:mannose-6-phosphate isomerase
MQKAYKLHGVNRHYDWGGFEFIPSLMNLENTAKKPFAEYWMGAHTSAPAMIDTNQGQRQLDVLVQSNLQLFLGATTANNFGALPYLFKILDVAKMLSIQVHPSKENALIGFELEEKAGIAIDASNRNYKDKNHKPEVMVALSDFWLLHGFLAPELLESRLNEFEYFHSLKEHFNKADYKTLYSYFMQLSAKKADAILKPLLHEAIESVKLGKVDKSHPHWWAHKYYNGVLPDANIDKGIFSIYILNIVQVQKYQGVFQGAGLLHAYLEGQNIELMANSDNVLRGGLTPKHIDIDELINHVQFVPTYPNVLKGEVLNSNETIYPCPVPDFGLSKIALNGGDRYTINTHSLEMLLIMEGEVIIDNNLYKAGEVAMAVALEQIEIHAQTHSVLFKSFVP